MKKLSKKETVYIIQCLLGEKERASDNAYFEYKRENYKSVERIEKHIKELEKIIEKLSRQ